MGRGESNGGKCASTIRNAMSRAEGELREEKYACASRSDIRRARGSLTREKCAGIRRANFQPREHSTSNPSHEHSQTMLEEALIDNLNMVKQSIGSRKRNKCDVAATLLAYALNQQGITARVVTGKYRSPFHKGSAALQYCPDHAWVQTEEFIIDPTRSQFDHLSEIIRLGSDDAESFITDDWGKNSPPVQPKSPTEIEKYFMDPKHGPLVSYETAMIFLRRVCARLDH